MPLLPRRFRFSAKNFFLTYPQCTLSKEEALSQLCTLQLLSNKKFVRVARELHEDGQPHLHVLIQLQGKAQITNQRLFDLQDAHSGRRFHPNIQTARSSSDVKAYVEKKGDYIDWGEFQIDGRSSRGGPVNLAKVYSDALNANFAEISLQIIKENDPKSFFLQYHNLKANADRIFARPVTLFKSKWACASFNIDSVIAHWIEDNFLVNVAARPEENNIYIPRANLDRPTSLILEGPTRTGKTAWACSLGPHNYIRGHMDFNANTFRNDVMYNVLDDVSHSYLKLKHWKELIGAQSDWQSNCKYGKPVKIKGGIPAIILCNPGPDASYFEFLEKIDNISLKGWTAENAKFSFITSPMFQSAGDPTATTRMTV